MKVCKGCQLPPLTYSLPLFREKLKIDSLKSTYYLKTTKLYMKRKCDLLISNNAKRVSNRALSFKNKVKQTQNHHLIILTKTVPPPPPSRKKRI